MEQGGAVVVDLDVEKFFDRVNHDVLMDRLSRRIGDARLLRIIRRFLSAGMLQGGVCVDRREGTPQGGPLSPLPANLLLDDLDKELEKRGHRFCRYADDCNIYVRTRPAGRRVMASVTRFLEGRLRSLGIREDRAWMPAGSGKGWWRLAHTAQAHASMTGNWFAAEGLQSLSAHYLSLQLGGNRRMR